MGGFIVRRAGQALIVLFLTSVMVFALGRFSGDPTLIILGDDATPEAIVALREALGLDRPIPVQYLDWVSDALRGDLGTSFRTSAPVSTMIGEAIPNTLRLAAVAIAFAVIFGAGLGVISALRRGSWIDRLSQIAAFVGMSAPNFLVAIVLVLIFSVNLGWLPTSGSDSWQNYVLPGITLSFGTMSAGVLRLVRSGMLDSLSREYIILARVKGLRQPRVVLAHALRNALIPVVSFIAVYVAIYMSGTVAIETIFRWPGIGLLVYNSVLWRDYPLLQGVVLFVGAGALLASFVADVLYALIDPRVRI